jgi:hypothetical protein
VSADPPLPCPPAAHRRRRTAIRLRAGLDKGGLCLAAAYVSMAVDAIEGSAAFRQGRDEGAGSPHQDEAMLNGVDLDFTLDEQGRVWMIREGDCYVLGPTEAVCTEMRRFLAGVAVGGDGYG